MLSPVRQSTTLLLTLVCCTLGRSCFSVHEDSEENFFANSQFANVTPLQSPPCTSKLHLGHRCLVHCNSRVRWWLPPCGLATVEAVFAPRGEFQSPQVYLLRDHQVDRRLCAASQHCFLFLFFLILMSDATSHCSTDAWRKEERKETPKLLVFEEKSRGLHAEALVSLAAGLSR